MNVSKLFKSLVLFAALACFGTAAMAQGVTTSSLSGRILDANGEALIGANVLAVHTPSGTVYGNSTDLDGYYRIPGMRVGGPYTITVSYTGYEDFKREGIFLTLGQTFQFNATMQETATELEGIVITSSRSDIFDGNRTGQETVVDEKTINEIPTITRAIGDFARFNPLANISEDTDGFVISLAGQNARYNTIYIDGAVNNDAFGLADSGTNGGQTGVQPISIDAIEQFQIAIAPFDVRQSGFAGGSINAVTRSGTNNLEGSAYYFTRSEALAGNRPGIDIEDRQPLADFSATTYGFRLGGPIIKNKLFFFANAEIQRDEIPQPFDISDYEGFVDANGVETIRDFVSDSYGYEIGSFDNNTSFLNSEKFLIKLDYNINDNNKLSFRHSFVNADNLEARGSSRGSLNFINGSESFVSQTNSSALELNTLIGSTMSNNLKIGLTIVRDDRDPSGDPFPTVFLEDGDDGGLNFGAERFSTANLLNQDIFTINNDFSIYKGRHNLVFGVNFEYFNAGNLFIRNNYGRYRWFDNSEMTGVEQFLADMPATEYERSFSQVDNIAGDESSAIAEFGQMLLGIYAQDEFQVNNDFKLTYGLRIDIPFWTDDQPINEQFNNNTIPAIESFGYDLKGAKTGQFIDPQLLFSPRLGFNYNVGGSNRTQLRGGVGIFTSRLPLVWPGGAYNNYGFNIGEAELENVEFEPDVQKQPVMADLANPVPSGQVDLFAADFKLPQVLKANLAVDHKLPWGMIGTLEGIFTQNINAVRYENFNIKPSDRNLTAGGDNRPLFDGASLVDPTYTYIMLASNTSVGYSYNLAATLTKPFDNGFTATLSYSYGDSFNAFDGTSSQNNSQWRGYHNPMGRNDLGDPQRSFFAAGHRVFGQFSYSIDYLDFGSSTLSLNINAQTGGHFSHVIGVRNRDFVNDRGFDSNELYYVPENADEAFLVDVEIDGVTYTAEDQWAILDQYIENDPHLSERRGDYAQRNGGRIPMQLTADLRFIQDFYLKVGDKKHTLQFTADIFNFTNLLNPEWGLLRRAGRFGNYRVVNLANDMSDGNTTPEYTIDRDLVNGVDPWEGNGNLIDTGRTRSSRWQAQIGVRYIFQ